MGRPGFASATLPHLLTSRPGSPSQAGTDLSLSQASVRPHVMVSRTLWKPGQLGPFQTQRNAPSGPALFPPIADSGDLGPCVLFRLFQVWVWPWVVGAHSPGHQPQDLFPREGHLGETQASGSSKHGLGRDQARAGLSGPPSGAVWLMGNSQPLTQFSSFV